MLDPLSYEGWEPRGYQGAGAAIGAGGSGGFGGMVPHRIGTIQGEHQWLQQ